MNLEQSTVPVWDPFIRMFHWCLVLIYLVAWVSAEEVEWLHIRAGYFILALVFLRILWGLIGSRHARFSDFIHGPHRTLDYLRDLGLGRPRHFVGHNPAGGWMIIALLLILLATGASGLLMNESGEDLWEELHEGLANLTLLLVFIHLAGVAVSSLLHGENLVKAMITGRKFRGNQNV